MSNAFVCCSLILLHVQLTRIPGGHLCYLRHREIRKIAASIVLLLLLAVPQTRTAEQHAHFAFSMGSNSCWSPVAPRPDHICHCKRSERAHCDTGGQNSCSFAAAHCVAGSVASSFVRLFVQRRCNLLLMQGRSSNKALLRTSECLELDAGKPNERRAKTHAHSRGKQRNRAEDAARHVDNKHIGADSAPARHATHENPELDPEIHLGYLIHSVDLNILNCHPQNPRHDAAHLLHLLHLARYPLQQQMSPHD